MFVRYRLPHLWAGSIQLRRALLALCLISSAARAEVVLFDGGLGTTPSAQGWPFFADPVGSHSVTQTAGAGFTTLNTVGPITDRGGYFSRDPVLGIFVHPNMPVLNRQAGYSINFSLRMAAETHVTGPGGDDNGDGLADRAGFSVITIASDQRGLEVSFWEDSIWVQNDDAGGPSQLFTQAENAPLNTTSAMRDYRLEILNDRYRIAAAPGIRRPLAGRVRDYRNFGGNPDPYEIPSFLFFGDNTTRGESISQLARMAVSEIPQVCSEIDALVQRIANGTFDAGYDLNNDGSLTLEDVAQWREEAGNFYLGAGRVFPPGDADLNGVVDGLDFAIWNARKFSVGSGWCSGDFDANGLVDGQDFGIWNQHKASSVATTAIPEPGSWWAWYLLLLGIRTCRAHTSAYRAAAISQRPWLRPR
jgi:hypothetical protein